MNMTELTFTFQRNEESDYVDVLIRAWTLDQGFKQALERFVRHEGVPLRAYWIIPSLGVVWDLTENVSPNGDYIQSMYPGAGAAGIQLREKDWFSKSNRLDVEDMSPARMGSSATAKELFMARIPGRKGEIYDMEKTSWVSYNSQSWR